MVAKSLGCTVKLKYSVGLTDKNTRPGWHKHPEYASTCGPIFILRCAPRRMSTLLGAGDPPSPHASPHALPRSSNTGHIIRQPPVATWPVTPRRGQDFFQLVPASA